MTITLAAVYAPIGFVSGLTGALFREFAFTLAGSVIVSGVIALTLSPMMCSRLLKPPQPSGRGFAGLARPPVRRLCADAICARLHKTLNFRAVTVLILVGVLALTAVMFMSTPKELAPEEDQGAIFALIKAPQYSNLDYMEKMTAKFQEAADTIPEKDHVFIINGFNGVHQGFGGLILKPWGERKRNQKADFAGAAAEARGDHRRPDHRLCAAVPAGLDRRPAGAIRAAHDRRLSASSPM